MYRENEIAKARLALLNNTNMVEYAMDEFKKIHKTEDVPEGKSRWKGVRVRDGESKWSCNEAVRVYQEVETECAESCYNELNETKVIPVLSDAELEEYGVREMILFNFRSSVKS